MYQQGAEKKVWDLDLILGTITRREERRVRDCNMVGHSDLKDGKLWLPVFLRHIIICLSCTGNSEG